MSILDRITSVKVVVTSAAIAAAVFATILARLPNALAAAMGYEGTIGLFALDTTFSPSASNSLLMAYGENGRHAVIVAHLVFDFVYPVAYTLFLVGALGLIGARLGESHQLWKYGQAAALGGGASDVLENIGIITLALVFPKQPVLLGWVTTAFTTIKWGLLGLSVLTLVVSLGMWSRTRRLT